MNEQLHVAQTLHGCFCFDFVWNHLNNTTGTLSMLSVNALQVLDMMRICTFGAHVIHAVSD